EILRYSVHATPNCADPHVDFSDCTDNAALHQLDCSAIIAAGVDLRAHLGYAPVLGGGLGHQTCLSHGMREWLFAQDVQPSLQSSKCDGGVPMVWCRDNYSIEVLLLEKPAEIRVDVRLRLEIVGLAQHLCVYIA